MQDALELKMSIQQNLPHIEKQVKIATIEATGAPSLRGFVSGKTTVAHIPPELSADKLVIELPVPGNTRKTKSWHLSIRDASGRAVKTFSGKNKLPQRIEWDWLDDNGKRIAPGHYSCHLRAQSRRNAELRAQAGPLAVVLIRRKVRLQFASEPSSQTARPAGARQTIGLEE